MALATEFQGLDEILKIAPEKQHSTVLEKLKARRKELADIFFDKAKSTEDRMKVQDELAKLHDYFHMKTINKISSNGRPGARPITMQEREDNCNNFKSYLRKIDVWQMLGPDDQARALATVWGGPRG